MVEISDRSVSKIFNFGLATQVWKISHKNPEIINFSTFRSKKISLGQVKKYPSLFETYHLEGLPYISTVKQCCRFRKFPLKIQIFQFFPLWVKKISSGWVKKYPGRRHVGLLFTAGQKYARVWSGPTSTIYSILFHCILFLSFNRTTIQVIFFIKNNHRI